jgi:ABC-type polysaccharide/polyol phosphate transport system ATPase subunit
VEFESVTKRYRLGGSAGSLREALAGVASRRTQLDGCVDAVRGLSFEIDQGETVGIIGRNGAGKTTVLRLLSGITRPTSGCIRRRGRVSALIELGAGFHPDLTGRENVFLNGTILGLTRREVRGLFDEIVAFAELERFIDTPVKRYSSGMFVRLGFAVAAHTRPDILLVDEVLSVGDLAFQAKCMNRVGALQRDGVTIVLVSHHMVLIRRYCGRTIVLDEGAKLFDGESSDAIQVYEQCLQQGRTSEQQEGTGGPRLRGLGGTVRIVNVRTLDDDGRALEVVDSGQPVVVRIHYACETEVPDPVFEVALHSTALGGLLARLDSRVAGDRIGDLKPGRGFVDARLDGLWLRDDRINVSVSIFDRDYAELFDWREMACGFRVQSNFRGEGVLPVMARWAAASDQS